MQNQKLTVIIRLPHPPHTKLPPCYWTREDPIIVQLLTGRSGEVVRGGGLYDHLLQT